MITTPTPKNAIIVDIDGTLSIMQGRTPYEWDKVDKDACNMPVAELVRLEHQAGTTIFIVSSRNSCCSALTFKWLKANGIPCDHLYLRARGDTRSDVLVKREIYEKSIKGAYRIKYVLDDRDSVVSLWRSMGIACFQVNYGNF